MRSWYSFAVFFAIVSTIIGGVHYYLYARLARAPGLEAWQRVGAIVFLAGAILLPLGVIASRTLPRSIASVVATISYVWMGLVILLFFLTLGSELIRLGANLLAALNVLTLDPDRRVFLSRVLAGAVGVLGAGFGVTGYLSARGKVGVKRVDIKLARLPESLGGFKIAQLSDLHIGPTLGREWLTDVVQQTNALEPDIVAITGDLVDGSVADLSEHVAPLAELRATHGVFFVTGNHEYYSGVDAWITRLGELGVRVLRNERVSIGEGDDTFDLAGIDDFRAKDLATDTERTSIARSQDAIPSASWCSSPTNRRQPSRPRRRASASSSRATRTAGRFSRGDSSSDSISTSSPASTESTTSCSTRAPAPGTGVRRCEWALRRRSPCSSSLAPFDLPGARRAALSSVVSFAVHGDPSPVRSARGPLDQERPRARSHGPTRAAVWRPVRDRRRRKAPQATRLCDVSRRERAAGAADPAAHGDERGLRHRGGQLRGRRARSARRSTLRRRLRRARA